MKVTLSPSIFGKSARLKTVLIFCIFVSRLSSLIRISIIVCVFGPFFVVDVVFLDLFLFKEAEAEAEAGAVVPTVGPFGPSSESDISSISSASSSISPESPFASPE